MPHHASHALAEARHRRTLASREAEEHSDGVLTRKIGTQGAKLRSNMWLWAAAGAVGLAILLKARGRKNVSRFLGS